MYDLDDCKKLQNNSAKNIELAREYHKARKRYGSAKRYLDAKLAEAYNHGTIEVKVAYEKALILLTTQDEKAVDAYKAMIEEQQNYKGLEKVMEAIRSDITLAQSIIKYIKEV